MASGHPVSCVCRALGASPSGYYAHLCKPAGARRQGDGALKPLIEAAFVDSGKCYGSLRVVRRLAEDGVRACGAVWQP